MAQARLGLINGRLIPFTRLRGPIEHKANLTGPCDCHMHLINWDKCYLFDKSHLTVRIQMPRNLIIFIGSRKFKDPNSRTQIKIYKQGSARILHGLYITHLESYYYYCFWMPISRVKNFPQLYTCGRDNAQIHHFNWLILGFGRLNNIINWVLFCFYLVSFCLRVRVVLNITEVTPHITSVELDIIDMSGIRFNTLEKLVKRQKRNLIT